ncbi:hypothetical protein GGI12_001119 [Dipsacomyces acuminosporus]|nr:hypothetical protein GGI12_001119 [Dipsacomyces acuminosporus]
MNSNTGNFHVANSPDRRPESAASEYYRNGYNKYLNQSPDTGNSTHGAAGPYGHNDDDLSSSPYYSPTPATLANNGSTNNGFYGGVADKQLASDAYLHDNAFASGRQTPAFEKSPALRQRRRCCGGGYFCCFSRRCCCIFIPILVVILIGLGVTLFFVFPRIPEVKFAGVTVPNTRNGQSTRQNPIGQLLDNANINRKGVVTVPLVIHLNVTNPNYIPWTIHNVTVDGFIKNATPSGDNFPVGEGGLKEPFYMPKKSVGNDMKVWFNFRLDTNNTNYLDAANVVQQACTPGGPDLKFHYKAKVILKAISWLGIKPSIQDSVHFPCPINEITSLGINVSDLTGLVNTATGALANSPSV